MNAFLIVLFCYSFSLGPATMFQPSHYLTKCNATPWTEGCGNSVVALKSNSNEEDPWARIDRVRLAENPAIDPGKKMKSGSLNVCRNRYAVDPWGRD
jgi:hypothetical protein